MGSSRCGSWDKTTLRRNAHIMENNIDIEESSSKRDKGFTLVELLIVIVILGILATVTVFAVRGITDKGQTSACNTDKVTLQTAAEAYFAQYGTTTGIPTAAIGTASAATGNQTAAAVGLPAVTPTPSWAVGATPATSLKNAGFLRSVPTNYFVDSTGTLYVANATCGTVGTNVG